MSNDNLKLQNPTQPTAPPKVTLVGYSQSTLGDWDSMVLRKRLGPLQVIAIVWEQSKSTKPLSQIMEEVDNMDADALGDLMERVMEGVPVVEAVSFNFILENVSISWREQMVRHRVGTKPDVRVGVDWLTVDTVPEVADMSAWSQSMRLMDMSTFALEGRYRTPDSVVARGQGAVLQWYADMAIIGDMYKRWADAGLPLEDARDLVPLGATSRLSWTLNLRTLQHIVGKRGCTILQLGLWGPIIMGIVQELVTKVHPVFAKLVTPPCMKGNSWKGCIFPEDNARRLDGRDHNLPVCPLFIGRETTEIGWMAREAWKNGTIRLREDIHAEALRRADFWQRGPFSGWPLSDITNNNPAYVVGAEALALNRGWSPMETATTHPADVDTKAQE